MDNTFNISVAVNDDMPIQYRMALKINAREDLGKQLIEYLLLNKETMFVVETKEQTIKINEIYDTYKITCSLIPAQSKKVDIQKLEDLSYRDLTGSALDEVKRRIKNWFNKLFKTGGINGRKRY